MNREQSAFLLGGMVFGLVAGLLLGFVMFRPGVIASPPPAGMASGGTRQGGATMAPSTGGMDPGASGTAMMNTVMEQIAALKESIEKNPNDGEALARLGDMYFDAGKFTEAKEYYARAAALSPHDPELRSVVGLCDLNMGQPATALESYREALRHDPDFWPAVAYSVVAATELGDLPTAEEMLARLKTLNPSFELLGDFEARVATLKANRPTPGG